MDGTIHARGLVKRYGEVVALTGLDLDVPAGTILGLLGPNGAGKTTAVSILTTLVEPDEGRASVAGADVLASPGVVRERIGLSGQYAAVDDHLTGFENLTLIGRLSHLGRRPAKARAGELLERFALSDVGGRTVGTYSGGMRRRLDLACALVAEAPVMFLDEPTTGLDPRSRVELWDVVEELAGRGHTFLLTTQYMEEAERLADDIVVIDHGREIAHGTADRLKTMVGGERIEVTVASPTATDDARRVLASFAIGELHVDQMLVRAPIDGGATTLATALHALNAEGVEVREFGVRRPTLDDVFLTLTGHVAGTNASASTNGAVGHGAKVPAGAGNGAGTQSAPSPARRASRDDGGGLT